MSELIDKIKKAWEQGSVARDTTSILVQWDGLLARRAKLRERSMECSAEIRSLEKERKKLNRRVRAVNWVMRFVWGKGMLFSDQEIDEEIDIQFERDEWN